jgi:hypothetical protein
VDNDGNSHCQHKRTERGKYADTLGANTDRHESEHSNDTVVSGEGFVVADSLFPCVCRNSTDRALSKILSRLSVGFTLIQGNQPSE